eukprot:290176_1
MAVFLQVHHAMNKDNTSKSKESKQYDHDQSNNDQDDGHDFKTYDKLNQNDNQIDDIEPNTCANCAKSCVFGFNFVFLLIGVALIIISLLARHYSQLNIFGIFDDDYMVYISISFAVLLIIISFLGCSGAITETKCLTIIYIVLLIISFIIAICCSVYTFLSASKLNEYSKTQWNNFSIDEQIQFQNDNNCIGYYGSNGCSNAMQNNLQNNLTIIGLVSVCVAMYQLIMMILTLIFISCSNFSKRKANASTYEIYQ